MHTIQKQMSNAQWWLAAFLCVAGTSSATSEGFRNPSWLGSTTEVIRITDVEFTDTATILSFHERYKPGWWIQIAKETFLEDMSRRRYKAIRGEGITLGGRYVTPESGEGRFKVLFEPMPEDTRCFDFVEGFQGGNFRILGIHEAGQMPEVPQGRTFQMTDKLEQEFFRADTACVRGRIEGYSREWGFDNMQYNRSITMTGEDAPITIDIREDGTFECRFFSYHPEEGWLLVRKGDKGKTIKFYAEPGKTTDILVRLDGSVECAIQSPGTFSLRNSLKHDYQTLCDYPYSEYKEDTDSLKDFQHLVNCAMRKMEAALQLADYMAWRYEYTPWERHLAENHTKLVHGEALLRCAMAQWRTIPAEKTGERTILDQHASPDTYRFLHRMPLDDVSCLALYTYNSFVNSYEFSYPLLKAWRGMSYLSEDTLALADRRMLAMEQRLSGHTKPSLCGRLALLRNMAYKMDDYLSRTESERAELAKTYTRRRGQLAPAALQRQADRIYAEALERWAAPVYALPECEGTKILRRLTEKYKGKYLLIDFWGMSCAPCRMAIQESKAMREALRDDKDVDFLFINAEGEAPEEEFRNFVTTHLAGEDVQQINRADYNKLMELFRFLGIPHYETLDPEGHVVRDGLRYADTPLFKTQVEQLKQKAKQSVK